MKSAHLTRQVDIGKLSFPPVELQTVAAKKSSYVEKNISSHMEVLYAKAHSLHALKIYDLRTKFV